MRPTGEQIAQWHPLQIGLIQVEHLRPDGQAEHGAPVPDREGTEILGETFVQPLGQVREAGRQKVVYELMVDVVIRIERVRVEPLRGWVH